MPARTLLDDMLADAERDREEEFDRTQGPQATAEWGRRWLEAKRRGGEDPELDWYRRNWRLCDESETRTTRRPAGIYDRPRWLVPAASGWAASERRQDNRA
jgi:hypothetical protein